MAVTATPATASKGAPPTGQVPRPLHPVRRRRLVRGSLAVLLVLGCAAAAVVVGAWAGDRVPVLAAARDLPAGHVLSQMDLRVLDVAADPEARLIPAAEQARVVGSTTTAPLAAGTLLVEGMVGQPRWPASGMALAAVALKPGRYPPSLTPGAHVSVVIAPPAEAVAAASGDPDAEPRRASATVISVATAGDSSGSAVVSLLLAEADAELVAATPADRVALVQIGRTQLGRGD